MCGTAPKGGAIVKNHKLGLFLLTRLTWTQNSFTIIISRIRRIYKISKPKMWLFHNFILKPNMIKRFTGYKNNQNSPKSPHKILRPSLREINKQNLSYCVPFEKYLAIKLEQLAHFSYVTIL